MEILTMYEARRYSPIKAASVEQRYAKILEACQKNYSHYLNVIGIGMGIKYTNGHAIDGEPCIHFYVRKKLKQINRRKKLPKFVYSRLDDDSIDYSRKLYTDVIELKEPKFVCKSGSEIDVIGESGTITIVFRNKVANLPKYYLITCAHVAGDLLQSPPVDPSIRSSCCENGNVLAETVFNSIQSGGLVEYDIALAKITSECSPLPEHQVEGSSIILKNFMPSSEVEIGMTLDCAFPISNIVSGTVSSIRTSLPLRLDGVEYRVKNLFLIDQTPSEGDSGGLLYYDNQAVGILVGMSEGWGLFQSIGQAFEYLQSVVNFPIKCF